MCNNVALQHSDIIKDTTTGGDYFIIFITASTKSLATTADGKIYRRMGDECLPVRSEDIIAMMEEKGIYQWELVTTKYTLSEVPSVNISKFVTDIRESTRASDFVRNKTDIEILEYYSLLDEDKLTHIGALWLGDAKIRNRLSYPITVQYIVYDDNEEKVRNYGWHDNIYTPKELLLDIERETVELKYYHELSEGLFRKKIPHYNDKLVRELLINAFAHKSFTISQDITIKLYPDRLEISSPGGLPADVTAQNILHTTNRRNPKMIEILKALALMEGEGSGYDLMYELNAKEVKKQPEVRSDYGSVCVIQESAIIDRELLPLLDYVLQNYTLSQKSFIAFGTIAKERRILATELSKLLQLTETERLRNYTERLLDDGLIISEGVKKGTSYSINPQLISNSRVNIQTTLKTIEPHTLKALIREDLRLRPHSKIREIRQRLGSVDPRELRKSIYQMVETGELERTGATSSSTYSLKELA